MRFDDSLETVLAADMSTPFGAQSAWRQLVDLIGRRRVPADAQAIARLTAIRAAVPPPVRAASARALADTDPPAALVRLFFDDEIAIAAPVLRAARLRPEEWIELLPGMSPAARSVLRHRRDLPESVVRALGTFGTTDFRIAAVPAADVVADDMGADDVVADDAVAAIPPSPVGDEGTSSDAAVSPAIDGTPAAAAPAPEPDIAAPPPVAIEAGAEDVPPVVAEQPAPVAADERATPAPDVAPVTLAPTDLVAPEPAPVPSPDPVAAVPVLPASPFVSVGAVALGLPVVAEALRRVEADAAAVPAPAAETAAPPEPPEGPFQIAELVARIDAYQRQRDDHGPVPLLRGAGEEQPALFDLEPALSPAFRFETDAAGVVRWIEGAARAPLIGLSLDLAALPGASRVDGIAGGAFRRRAGFADARLVVDGNSDAAGEWRITGTPVFDRASGRFTGYRGTARRPRPDESAAPARDRPGPAADALRQLVHELRTPTNAIAGFAEMIETQLLGPVPQAYRDQAGAIRVQAADLLVAIDDIDLAARIESKALDLRISAVPLAPMLIRIAGDLAPLAALRQTDVTIDPGPRDLGIAGDDRALERLIGRLMATLVSSGGAGETINVVAARHGDAEVALTFDRPRALASYDTQAILTIDAEAAAGADGAPLLGTGFALRLARNLAAELGGALTIDDHALILRLPAAAAGVADQALIS